MARQRTQPDLSQAGERNRQVDVLAQVRLKTGKEQWILLHMEVQSAYEPDFGVELSELEEELHMPYVTSIERLAEARGEARGRASLLLAQLAKSALASPKYTRSGSAD